MDLLEEWTRWAEREVSRDPERAVAAARAAIEAMAGGLSATAAACAGRLVEGIVLPSELELVRQERYRVDLVLHELAALSPVGDLTDKAIDQERRVFAARAEVLQGLLDRAQATQPAWSPPSRPRPAGSAAPFSGLSLREFFADQSILLISYSGAFLLIVATLLFELYGDVRVSGSLRFGAVLGLDVIFGIAALVCFQRPRLRLVGHTYLAISAIMLPLAFAAGYYFLALGAKGISTDLAVACAGLTCSLLYGILAVRLGSRAYAVLALLALPVGWLGLVDVLGLGPWRGVAYASLTIVYALGCGRWVRQRHDARLFAVPSEVLIHVASVASVVWTLFLVADRFTWFDVGAGGLQLSAALAVVAFGYVLHWRASGRLRGLWVAAVTAIPAVLSLNSSLHLGQTGASAELIAMGILYALAATWIRDSGLRLYLRLLAAAVALGCTLLTAQPDPLQAAILLVATGLLIGIAVQTRTPAWLIGAGLIFAVDWFWLARTALPPPPHPSQAALVLVYSPLPAVFAAAGLVTRLITGRLRWAIPPYLLAVVGGPVVGLAAVAAGDLTLAGWALVAFAAVAYAVGAVDRLWPALVIASWEAASGLAALLIAGSAPTYGHLLALTGLAWLIYVGRLLWPRSELSPSSWAQAHRITGLALMGLVATASFVTSDWEARSALVLADLLVVEACALMVFQDAWLEREPPLEYVAIAVASLGGVWIARYLGATNPQWYVLLPSLTLILAGLRIRMDGRFPASRVGSGLMVGSGAGLLVACSLVQSLMEEPRASVYTTLIVVEGVVAFLAGIGLRDRVLVVVGATGIALGALQSIFMLVQAIPLFAVFGLLAIALLVVGAGLTITRDRVREAGATLRDSWRRWD